MYNYYEIDIDNSNENVKLKYFFTEEVKEKNFEQEIK